MLNKPIVSVSWLKENLNNSKLIILDASTSVHEEKPDKRLIPNSLRVDLKNDFSDTNSDLPNTFPSTELFAVTCIELGVCNDSIIVIYDDKGIYTSPRIWWLFKTFGFSQVAVLDGGLAEWLAAKIETTEVYSQAVKKGNFKPKLNNSAILSYEAVLASTETTERKLLDARSKGRFDGTLPEPRATLKSGSIPNSCSLAYTEVLENGKYKTEKDLTEIFSQIVNNEDKLIFSCGSGITACIILLAAELVLPNEKGVFDGSWTEWAIKQGLTISE